MKQKQEKEKAAPLVAPQNLGPRSFTRAQMLQYLTENVKVDGDCLIWAGPYWKNGKHSSVKWRGRAQSARRLLLRLSGVHLARTDWVIPVCENDLCMNRKHLRVRHMGEVLREAHARNANSNRPLLAALAAKGRAKMPITEYRNVLEMLDRGMSYRQIARHYGVNPSRVSRAIKSWPRTGIDVTRLTATTEQENRNAESSPGAPGGERFAKSNGCRTEDRHLEAWRDHQQP